MSHCKNSSASDYCTDSHSFAGARWPAAPAVDNMLYDCLKPDVYHPTTGNAVASASTVAAVIQTGTLASSSYGGFSPPVAVARSPSTTTGT